MNRIRRSTSVQSFACILALALAANAAETTVQNDSFVSGGSLVVVGDFVAGEHAGVRLTSPCDGTIVAVQIGWNSEPLGAPADIQRAIRIYDGSAFPPPQPEIVRLDAPFLTPGFLNEFRFLDQDQTLPLSVPVTAGQQFYVTLQFDRATNVQGGSPSVFEDTDGCQFGKNVIFAIPGGWIDFCLLAPQGDFVIRAVINCAAPSGACCLTDGSCTPMTAADCTVAGGTYQGDFVDCLDANCPVPTGACCFPATGGCLVRTQADCAIANGVWKGAGTDCTIVCFPIGACCLPDGSCTDPVSPEDCAALGGVFQGDGTNCAGVNCPQPQGACCFAGGGCLVMTASDCGVAGGTWIGAGSNCDDANSNGTADACEAGAPCPGDVDGDGDVDVTDLAIVLANFGASGQGITGDLDNDGDVDISDLAKVLAEFGATC